MTLFNKKRIEIIAEATLLRSLLEMIDQAGAKGYTVVSGDVSGRGNRGTRQATGLPGDVFRNVIIVVVAAEAVAMRVVAGTQALLRDYAGVVFVSDVAVLRDEHF
jgi:nitrogen regulatory protein PII